MKMTSSLADIAEYFDGPEIPDQDTESASRRPGRPSKRTAETEAAILECLQLGLTIAETCDACGVSETQFRTWRRHFPDFAELVRRGQAEAVKIHLSIIRNAAASGRHWQASAWWLERRRPERWGRTERHTFEDRRRIERREDDEETADVSDFMEFLKIWSRFRGMRAEAAPDADESAAEPDFDHPPAVPETVAVPEGRCEIVSSDPDPSDLPMPNPEPATGEDEEPHPPVPPGPGRKTPSVFIGGVASGRPAEFDEADEATHFQDGCRLRSLAISHEGRIRELRIFARPGVNPGFLAAEAERLLMSERNRAILAALSAQKQSPGEEQFLL
jgi:hypothetical protein